MTGRGAVKILQVLSALLFPAAAPGGAFSADSAPAVISEIMFNPDGDENAREFIEIANRSSGPLSLEGWRIGDGAGFDLLVPVRSGSWILPAGGFAVVVDPDYLDAGEPYATIIPDTPLFTIPDQALGSRGLSNSTPEPVYLISAAGDTLSLVRYSIDCPAGRSWERVDLSGGDGSENFSASRGPDGTPGVRNSVVPPDRNPALIPASLRFEPPAPRPGERLDIFVSFRNAGLSPVSDVRVTIRILPDLAIGTVAFSDTIPPGSDAPATRLEIPRLPCGRLMLSACIEGESAGTGDDTLTVALDVPVPPGTLVLNEIMVAPREGPEWVEVLNAGSVPVSLLGWSMTDSRSVPSHPAAVDRFLSPGEFVILAADSTVVPGAKGAVSLALKGFPSLNNDGDTVVLLDPGGAPADSAGYDAAEPGVSRERISPRLGGGDRAWDLCTDPAGSTPGRQNSIYFSRVEDDLPSGGTYLTITPNPFSERVTIAYDLPFPLSRVRMTVYDRRGRIVTTLREVSESGSAWAGEWDGADHGRKLPAGPYLLFFEALNKNTGEAITIRKTLVLARKL